VPVFSFPNANRLSSSIGIGNRATYSLLIFRVHGFSYSFFFISHLLIRTNRIKINLTQRRQERQGFLSVFLGGVLVGVALIFTEENFLEVALLVIIGNIPVMIIEGFITAFSIGFIKKVQPEMLPGYRI